MRCVLIANADRKASSASLLRNHSVRSGTNLINRDDRELVIPSSPTAGPSAPKSPLASRPVSTTKTLRTSFVDLKRATADVQPIKFTDGFGRIVLGGEFDESKSPRAASHRVRDDAGRDSLVSSTIEQLQKAFIRGTVGQVSYV